MHGKTIKFTYIKFNKFFGRKSCVLCYSVEIYCRVEQTTDYSMAHAHYNLDI